MLPTALPASRNVQAPSAAPKGASGLEGLPVTPKRYPHTRLNHTGLEVGVWSLSAAAFSATCLAIGLLTALIGCYSGNRPPRIGANAPDFTLQDSDHKVTLSQFRGQVVVLNFWGSFCPPCIEETPSMVRMQARLKDKGVVVLGVSIDVDDAAYHKFLKDFNVNMVTVRDGEQKASSLYGTFGWPETYVIDRQGVIRRKFIGAVDWNSPEVTDFLSKL